MLEYQNRKTFLLKDILQIGQKEVFVISKIKNIIPWTYEIVGNFYEKELQKTNQGKQTICQIERL